MTLWETLLDPFGYEFFVKGLVAAVLAGAGPIEAIAVACVDAPEGSDPALLMPCGACRQVLAEFAGPETPVVVDRAGTFTLAALLPHAFRLAGG